MKSKVKLSEKYVVLCFRNALPLHDITENKKSRENSSAMALI